jgi:hypothetical protein
MFSDETRAAELAFHDNARAIITAMGAEWSAVIEPDSKSYARARRADGLEISLRLVTRERTARVQIWPCIPKRHGSSCASLKSWGVHSGDEPKATVALDRGPAVVAREALRRVVEPYAPFLAAIRARDRADTDLAARGKACLDAVAATLGIPVRCEGYDSPAARLDAGNTAQLYLRGSKIPAEWYGEIQITGSSVEFRLRSVPHSDAVKLAEFIALLNGSKTNKAE